MARGAMWFWLYGKKDGRAFRAGPYSERERASSDGIKWCGADFEVFELPTHNTAEAGRMLKHKLAQRMGLGAGMLKHQLGVGDDSQRHDTKAQPQEESW